MNIEYKENKIDKKILHSFLIESDSEFDPVLSLRINLSDYAQKMIDNAKLFEAYMNGKLVALVAVYANDYIKKSAYITYVYCKKEYRCLGISNMLFIRIFSYLKQNSFQTVSLEVSSKNIPAVNLYKKFGFEYVDVLKNNPQRIIMSAFLNNTDSF